MSEGQRIGYQFPIRDMIAENIELYKRVGSEHHRQ